MADAQLQDKIIGTLRMFGRLPAGDLARRVGKSHPACLHQSVIPLQKRGQILRTEEGGLVYFELPQATTKPTKNILELAEEVKKIKSNTVWKSPQSSFSFESKINTLINAIGGDCPITDLTKSIWRNLDRKKRKTYESELRSILAEAEYQGICKNWLGKPISPRKDKCVSLTNEPEMPVKEPIEPPKESSVGLVIIAAETRKVMERHTEALNRLCDLLEEKNKSFWQRLKG
jgi:hypothetical protein